MIELFGQKCQLVKFLNKSIRWLMLLSQDYMGSDWVGDVSNQCIHKCSKATTKFFDCLTQASTFTGYSLLAGFMVIWTTLESSNQDNCLPTAHYQPSYKVANNYP